MNIAVIFAGGVGQRLHPTDRPKQFLLVHGKPIIVHTVEIFQQHQEIDGIVVACLQSWIPYMEQMKATYHLDKISAIVPGGQTGQMSIYNGLCAAEEIYGTDDVIALIHDGVRPLITAQTISDNIACVKERGSAITCTEVTQTVIEIDDDKRVRSVPDRPHSRLAQAPQSFWLADILAAERKAITQGQIDIIDSCTLMHSCGFDPAVVIGPTDNIKITTLDDYNAYRAIYEAKRKLSPQENR